MATMSSTSPVPRSLDQQVEIETPEHVAFAYTMAGVGTRAAAALVDTAICVGGYVLLLLLAGWATLRYGGVTGRDLAGEWVTALVIAGQFLIFWGYYVLFEGLRDGQTPGKRYFRLRVVQDGGYAVTLGASAARNLVRLVDMQPGILYGVGLLSVAVSRSGKRLGDYVAGTMVVQERRTAFAGGDDAAAEPRMLVAGPALLDEAEFAVLQRFVARRSSLDRPRREALTGQLVSRFRARVPGGPSGDLAFLIALEASERRLRELGGAARSDTGAHREQHALVARGLPDWRRFGQLLDDAERRGLSAMSEDEVSDFVARYRAITGDLARLRTASRDRDVDAVYYLSRLVAGGHGLLYRQRRLRPAVVGDFVFDAIPAEMRRSWRPIALAAVLLFGPAIGTFEAVRRSPQAAAALVPRGMVDRAETGVVRHREGGGYLPEEDAQLRGAILTSAITTNNLQVTFGAFALGITAGVGTVFVLVVNGVVALGAGLGYYARMGILDQILGFVLPHGVLELTAICLGGGAGLQLAAAILLPGALTRRDALVERGRRALTLVAGASLLLLVAGLIEGNISPRVWPLWEKAAVSAATAVLLAWYWTLGMGRGAAAERSAPMSS